MWDIAIKSGLGVRPRSVEQVGARAPRLHEEGAPEQNTSMAEGSPFLNDDGCDVVDSGALWDFDKDPPKATGSSARASHEGAAHINAEHSYRRSSSESMPEAPIPPRSHSIDFAPGTEEDRRAAGGRAPRASQLDDTHADNDDEPLITFTATKNASLASILDPVHDQLLELKETTPAGYPDYERGVRNSHILGQDYSEILCERIAGIGEHIKCYLAGIPETSRGRMELDLCHYIASEYWPLLGKWGTHLTIMAMYTNTLARRLPLEHYASAEASWREWVREREDRREAGLDVWSLKKELARFGIKQARNKHAAFAGLGDTGRDETFVQAKQEDNELAMRLAGQEREQQEEQDRLFAARLQAEDNAAGPKSGRSNHAFDDKGNPDTWKEFHGGEDRLAGNWDDTRLVDVDEPPSLISLGSSLSSDRTHVVIDGAPQERDSDQQPRTMTFSRDPDQIEQDDIDFAIKQSLRDRPYSSTASSATLTMSDAPSLRAHLEDGFPDQAEVMRLSHSSTSATETEQVDSQVAMEGGQQQHSDAMLEPVDPLIEQSSHFSAQPPSFPKQTHSPAARSNRHGTDPPPSNLLASHKRYNEAKDKMRQDLLD